MKKEINTNLKIGFVILTWNSDKVIDKCLKSIFGLNTIVPYVVIVDNGSRDNTVNIINYYCDNYKDSILFITYDENKGTTVPRNKGLNILQKKDLDYFCILDSDTQINDKSFIVMINELIIHKEYGIIGPKMVNSSGVVQMSARAFPTVLEKIFKAIPYSKIQSIGEKMEKQEPISNNLISYPVDYLMSACWLIHPDVIKKVGLLDENIFYAPEDAEYCIRVWKSGYQVAYCPRAVIIHEWQRLSKKKIISKMNFEHIKGLIYMFNKHHFAFTTKRLKKEIMLKEISD